MKNYVAHSNMPWKPKSRNGCALLCLCFSLLFVLPSMVVLSPAPEFDWTVDSEAQTAITENVLAAPTVTSATSIKPHRLIVPCPMDCVCEKSETVDCRGTAIRNVSNFLANQHVTKLDLSHTDVTQLGPMAFQHMAFLEDLNLAGNSLKDIDKDAFHHSRLKFLSLQKTNIKYVPTSLFSHLPSLQSIRLDSNDISQLDPFVFSGLTSLRQLRLDVNRLSTIPHEALSRVNTLEVLNLSYNKIKVVSAGAFRNLTFLTVLVLDHNDIEYIDDDAFVGLFSLKVLELRHNHINQIEPAYFRQLPLLGELYLNNNNVVRVKAGVFQQVSRLMVLELRGNPIVNVDVEAFAFLPRLKKLILSEVKELRYFPSLNGTGALELIRIDRAKINSVPSDVCHFSPHLRSLDLKSNQIETLPDFSHCRSLRLIDLSHNRITDLPNYAFQHQSHLHDLLLSDNRIKVVPEHVFKGLRKLKTLDLSANDIESIHSDAFLPLEEIQDVNLGHNSFPVFPSIGLENALHIKVHNNPNLREFPSPSSFPRVKTLALSYAYHCCPFQHNPAYSILDGLGEEDSISDSIIFPSNELGIDLTAWAKGETAWVDSNPLWTNVSQQWASVSSSSNNLNLSEADIEKLLSSAGSRKSGVMFMTTRKKKNPVACIPEPSPFMPCQDLFDWWSLRCGVWIVFLMALLGNGAVVFVLIFARSKIDVPRFLVCNLGMADFFMGIYLGFLAVVDASTLGEFRMYAIPWQLSAGCQVAGFFGVLSSELSVFTLAVITMERNYAITHAMHLNKRLSLRHASYIMAAGWLFALIMAFLPLVGVSDYRKFAVCLPFEVGNSVSKGYVVFLMVINGVAFLILMGCYLKMYCAIRGSQAWNSNDSRIAKRMALLVFTDFLCWAPIAFFSLTAASGLQFVSLEEAKIFTVFILPLNSCCNPFLYAILTKQFKKDCVLICKAIEESRVTRGIGRCRHSSNFSNRQTPGNTNSLGDRNSSKDGSSCQCQGRGLLKEDKMSISSATHRHHRRHNRNTRLGWFRSPLRAFLRRIRAAEREMGESSSSANEYAYQIAEIQQKQLHRNKHHRRAESVSSDTYSTSRSDSVKAVGCGLPLRMVGRRRNSWTVTRKPSSDSNLSSSRNDSSTSAMTASTSAGTTTWRNSRSSVSSEGGSSCKGSMREREKLTSGTTKAVKIIPPNAPMTYLPPIEGQRRSSSIREKGGRVLPTSPLAAGILRQQSVATPTGNFVHRTVIPQITSSVASTGACEPTTSYHVEGAHQSSESKTSAFAGAKSKPRLTRQIAVQEDGINSQCPPSNYKCVSFNTANMVVPNKEERNYCPLHSPRLLQGVWESSIEEDFEDDPIDLVEDSHSKAKEHKKFDKDSIFAAVASIYTNRDKNRLGLSGFIPRKLSTISSRSCSVNPDNDGATDGCDIVEESTQQQTQATSQNQQEQHYFSPVNFSQDSKKTSNELLNVIAFAANRDATKVIERQLSKSDNDLYRKAQPKTSRKSIGSIVRLTVTPEATNTTSPPSSSDYNSSSIQASFGADILQPIDNLAIQSPESRELEGSVKGNQKLNNDTSESDPLMQ